MMDSTSLNTTNTIVYSPSTELINCRHHPQPRIMTSAFLHLSLFVPILLSMVTATRVQAQANDMFPTKESALQRAKELKCTGAFAMGKEWMPCMNFETYEKAIR